MDIRKAQGIEIARLGRITKKGDVWLVPSQSRPGVKYKVTTKDDKQTCNCADFKANGDTCKHIHAVIHRVEYPDAGLVDPPPEKASKKKKPTHPQDWPNYNAAQTNEKRHFMELLAGLCEFIDDGEVSGPGRPRTPLSDMAYLVTYKLYEQCSSRRVMTDVDFAHCSGFVCNVPHFNTINNYMRDERMTDVLLSLIEISSLPFRGLEETFAIDSSGFAASPYDRWQEIKPSNKDADNSKKKKRKKESNSNKDGELVERERRTWTKVHIIIGVNSHIVTAVIIKDKDASDTQQLRELINKTAANFTVKQVCADKAYGSIDNYKVMAALGIDPFIPFKKNHSGAGKGRSGKEHKTEGGKLWKDKFLQFRLHSDEFEAIYHQRSNVETVFSMIKKKFGCAVRSKSERGMMNEVLCKILCHNICCIIKATFELGLDTNEIRPTIPRSPNFRVIEGGFSDRAELHPS